MGINAVTHPYSNGFHGSASPVGKINWKSTRLGHIDPTWWSAIETSEGVYDEDALNQLDEIVTFNKQNGASIIMGLYGTPLFYCSSLNNPTVPDTQVVGPKGQYGEGANPTSLTAVENFVSMMIGRYNLPGGTWYDEYGATLGKGIKTWECWNEPKMDTLGNNATGQDEEVNRFWWGTKAQLVALCAAQYNTIKALDPTVEVSSPGFTADIIRSGLLNTFFSLGGDETCDSVSIHPYSSNAPFFVFGDWPKPWIGDIAAGTDSVAATTSWLERNGYPHSVWVGEWGFDATPRSSSLVAFDTLPYDVKYKAIARLIMCASAQGATSFHPWVWSNNANNNSCAGNYYSDEAVQDAYNDCVEKLSGKTIVEGKYKTDGTVILVFSDNISWIV